MIKGKMFKNSFLFVVLLLIGSLLLVTGCGSDSTNPDGTDVSNTDKEFILIGRVNPATGPLAAFGEGTPFIEESVIEAVNQEGGIYIEEYDKKLPVKLIVADSESSSTKAAEAANKLILNDKVDLLIGSHTMDTVIPVSSAAERNKLPCITTECPGGPWLETGDHYWSFHAFWRSSTQIDNYFDLWDLQETNKNIGLLCPNDSEGIVNARLLQEKAEARGYNIVDPGRFPANTKDYTTIINEFKKNDVDIVCGVMVTPDFATVWKQMHQQGYVPKTMTCAKAILFPNDVEQLGDDLGLGLTSEVWWSTEHPYKSSITGQSAAELCQMYTDETGKQASAAIGYKHANVEIAIDVLKRAQSLDPDKIREATIATDLDTIVGHIKFDDKNFCETNLVVGQWQHGEVWPWEMIILSNKTGPEIPVSEKEMIFPLPGCTQ